MTYARLAIANIYPSEMERILTTTGYWSIFTLFTTTILSFCNTFSSAVYPCLLAESLTRLSSLISSCCSSVKISPNLFILFHCEVKHASRSSSVPFLHGFFCCPLFDSPLVGSHLLFPFGILLNVNIT